MMFQQHRIRRDSTDPAGAEELYGGDQKVNRADEQIAHGVNAITLASCARLHGKHALR